MIELRRDWSEAAFDMQKEMERLMNEVVNRKPPAVRFSPRTWQPAIDVYETDDEVVVLVELAGVGEDEIEVTMQDRRLAIRGERRDVRRGIKRAYSRMEISWGPFDRSVSIPADVDEERVKATFQAGILEVVLPKLGRRKTHRVSVRRG
ncbi:MAG: Hsp20/alpha crystallin family protein [Dehalococcoidia bacterium]|nr:Hsp20/alpha crystallin family protein [Dehalococcoidia bacterium]